MAEVDSSRTNLELGEEWIVRVLQGIEISKAARQVVVRLDDRRVCLTVVASDGSEDAWSRYSQAAARRAEVTGDRLRPLVASGRTDEWFYAVYDAGDARPLSAQGELGSMSGAQCLQLLHGIGRGLDQAAAADLYPTELSPDSVLADPVTGAVLADLGLAREALGTPSGVPDREAPWVAPEVLLGEKAVERSAVYSFGALMYTMLTGAPPPEEPLVRELRPDLPEALDIVISTAMARDPRRRYRTVSETRSLANILMQGDLMSAATLETAPEQEAPRPRPEPRAKAAALRRRTAEAGAATAAGTALVVHQDNGGHTADVVPRAERGLPVDAPRGVLLALAAAVVIVGALAGVLLAGPGPDEPPAPKTFSRGGLQVRLPGDWRGTVPAPGALAARPVGDPGSGLSLELVDVPVEREEQGNPVRLGRLEAWREPGAEVVGARAAVRYVVPTETGKLVATCRASQRAAAGTLAGCERVLSTLQLRAATGLPIAAVVEQQERWQGEVGRLGAERAAARRSLASVGLPAGQRLAAEALGRVHDRAGIRFAALPGGESVAEAARRTAAAYRALARVANGESSRRFNGARARVRRSEAGLREAIAES
jgi:hypothetical protein